MKKNEIISIILICIAFGFLIYGLVYFFSKSSPTISTLLAGAIGFIISKFYESIRENKQKLHEKKREVYLKLIKPYRDVIINPSKNNGELEVTPEIRKEAIEAAFDAILYASDDVVRTYGEFRNMPLNNVDKSEIILNKLALVLRSMRKDLGNQYSNLDEVQILKMFINMSSTDEERYRSVFKTLK